MSDEMVREVDNSNGLLSDSFVWITNRTEAPFITIDAHSRFYVSAPARKLLGLPNGEFSLYLGFDYESKRIGIANPRKVRIPGMIPYTFDKRSYSKAKMFVKKTNIKDMLPVRFVYEGTDVKKLKEDVKKLSKDEERTPKVTEGAFVFKLEDWARVQ